MSRTGFRFVHATCLCLDEPLVGTGALTAEEREIAEDATFQVWNGIVRTCEAAQVEFLLLTGNSFHARTNSLRARVALEKGFEQLAAHDISVFIAPGNLDPASSWKRGMRLPDNVTLLTDEDHEPVAVMRQQRVIASIYLVASPNADESRWSSSGPAAFHRPQAPFCIGVVPAGTPVRWDENRPVPLDQPGVSGAAASLVKTAIDQHLHYLALGEGVPRTEHFAAGVAHDPGSAQSLSRQISGPRGCSVIDVSAHGETTIDRVALAPVRWEEIRVETDRHCNWDDLAERMALALLERSAEDDERLWIVQWRLSGEGTVYDALAEEAAQQDLWKRLEKELSGAGGFRRVYRLDRGPGAKPTPVSEAAAIPSGTGLLGDFQLALQEVSDGMIDELRREILSEDWLKPADAKVVREVLQQTSKQRLLRRAQTLAGNWLE